LNPSLDFPVGSFGATVLYCFIGAVPHAMGVLRFFTLWN